jgi:hypothetical protein
MKVKIKRVRGGSTGDQRDYGLTTGSIWNYEDKPVNNNLAATISAVPRDEANIEAERGETVVGDLDADGNLEHAKIGGKRHYEGGTPLSVPDGSFIFSDTSALKIKNKELLKNIFGISSSKSVTPAHVAKKYELNKYKDMLEDPTVDPMTKKTAQMMIDNNLKKLGQLALIQEGMKGFPDGIPDIAMPLFGSDMGQGMGGGEQGQMGMAKYGGLPKAQKGIGYGTKNAGKAASFNTTGNYTAEQAQRAQAIAKAAEEKKKAEIAANIAKAKKDMRNAIVAKKIQAQNLQDLSGFTNKEGRAQNYTDLMNRFGKFRDSYVKEMQDAIKYNIEFVPSEKLKNEQQAIKTAVDAKTGQGEIVGSATFPSWMHPLDAWNPFSIAGGTDQGQIDDMADVAENMISDYSGFMKQTFPTAYNQQATLKAKKNNTLYNNNIKNFTSQLQKVIDTHQKLISEGKTSPYDETNIQAAYSLLGKLQNFTQEQANNVYSKRTVNPMGGVGTSSPVTSKAQALELWNQQMSTDPDFAKNQVQRLNNLIKNSGIQGVDSQGYMMLDQKLFPAVSATGVATTPKEDTTGVSDFDKATTTAEQANQASKDSSTTIVLDPNNSTKEEKKKKTPVNTGTKTNTGTTTNQTVQGQNANVFVPTTGDTEYKYGGDLDQAQNGKQKKLSYDIRLKQLRDFGKSKGFKFIRPTYFDEANPLSDVGYQSPAKDKRYKRNASGEIVPVSGLKNSKTNIAYNGIDDFINYADPFVNFEDYDSDEAALKFNNTNTSDADRRKWALDKWKSDLASKDPAVRKKAGNWFATRANAYGEAVLGPGSPQVIDTTQDKYWEIGTKNLNTPFPVRMDQPIDPGKEQEDLTEKKTKTEMGDMPDVAYQYGYERAPWFRQDLANLYGSVAAAANIDRGAPPIMQSSYSPLVDATFLDPAQQIAALQGNLNTTQAAIRASQDGPNAVANLIAASASSAPNIANIIADYDNKNVGIANQRDQLNNQIMTRDLGLNRDYVKRFYDESVVRDQQYDNAVADAASEVRKAYMQGETNRDSATSANVQNPNYSFDPLSGRYYFKKGYDPRTGAPLDDQSSPGDLFKYYTENYNLTPDQAIELITGTRAKSKAGYGNENTAAYGGYIHNPMDVIWNY